MNAAPREGLTVNKATRRRELEADRTQFSDPCLSCSTKDQHLRWD